MNIAGCYELTRFFDPVFSFKDRHGRTALFVDHNHQNKDQYVKKTSSVMPKSIFSKKSLHDHVIIVILTPASSECTRWKHQH